MLDPTAGSKLHTDEKGGIVAAPGQSASSLAQAAAKRSYVSCLAVDDSNNWLVRLRARSAPPCAMR